MLKSKTVAWAAFILIILVIGLTFTLRPVWWAFSDIFFAFMMVFSHLMAVYIYKLNPFASRSLDRFALVFGILTVVALVVEVVLFQILVL